MTIEITGLCHRYGQSPDLAVDHLDLEIPKGQFYVLLGPSGCGKTTTMRCIAGLETPQEGRITVNGRVVRDDATNTTVPTHKRNIGMVFQSYAIWPHKTVFENVAFPMRMKGISSRDARPRVIEILARVGLEGFADRGASMLSGGQMQRVALARSIAMQPSVLLFDEPLSNLDARLRESLRFEIRALQQEFGFTAVYVTHDQSEALALGDEIAVMRDGKIIQRGAPIELYRRPATEFVAEFLGVGNRFEVEPAHSGDEDSRVRIADSDVELMVTDPLPSTRRVVACIRDEDVIVVRKGEPVGPSINVLDGTVQVASFLGREVHYQCVAGGLTFRSSTPTSGDPMGHGDEVTIGIRPDAVRLVTADMPAGAVAA